nr:SRPBCC domain-containing protein [uncultured Chryseobacterium sp.]
METSIIIRKKIKAPIEKVWNALTTESELHSWYFDIPEFKAEKGEMFQFYEPGEERKYLHQIEIIEVTDRQKLKHSWFYPDFSEEKTFVTWSVELVEDETWVTLTHEGTEKLKDLGEGFSKESFTKGWNEIIGQSLKLYLEIL